MRVRLMLVGALAATALATGCVTPTSTDLQAAGDARVQAEQLLGSFVQALQQRDAQALEPLVAPHLRPRDVRLLQRKLLVGSSLAFYEGYAPDLAAALAEVSWREWGRDEALVEVPYTDPFDEESRDQFTLTSKEGRWYLLDFELKESRPGDLLNPPENVKQLLGGKAAELLERLRRGHLMSYLYDLPDEPSCRYRTVERTWWEKAVLDKPEVIHLTTDLECVQNFTMLDWPKPEEVSFAHAPGDGVAAFYEIPYVWPEAGIDKTDLLRVGFVFLRRQDGWLFYQLRLSAKGIPWSQ